MTARKLLIVDDMDSIRALVAAIARDAGFEVMQATNGEQALAACKVHRFDVVICDWTMPRMSGEEFIAKLRETDKATPVVMLTSMSDREKIQALVGLGINGFILKPFKPDQIYKALEGVKARPPADPATTPAPAAEAEAETETEDAEAPAEEAKSEEGAPDDASATPASGG